MPTKTVNLTGTTSVVEVKFREGFEPFAAVFTDPTRVKDMLRRDIFAPINRELVVASEGIQRDLQKDLKSITGKWENDPNFQVRLVVKQAKDRGSIELTTATTNERAYRIWRYVDEGTPRHDIPVVGATKKSMPIRPYSPRTAPNSIVVRGRGLGGYKKPVAFAKSVDHPGIQARNFTGAMIKKYKPEFRRVTRNAVKRAIR